MKKMDDQLSEEIKRKYEETLELTYQEFSRLDLEMAAEVERAKTKLQKLQEAKKSVTLVYEGVCARLGLTNSSDYSNFSERGNSSRDQFVNDYGNFGDQDNLSPKK